jgi:Xaa-Pro aminopeptidase
MVLSNEPGLYLAGHYGIRIENLCVVTEVLPRSEAHPYGPFYELDDLTLVPYCRKLIDPSLLSPTELAWIDGYHARVLDALLPGLAAFPDHDAARAWLLAEAAPLAGASA